MGSQGEARMKRKNEIALEKNNKVSSSSSTLPGRDAAVYSVFTSLQRIEKQQKATRRFAVALAGGSNIKDGNVTLGSVRLRTRR